MYIIDALKKFIEDKPLIFTTPGHSQRQGMFLEAEDLLGENCFKADLSEVSGLDNLQNPSGIILRSQKWASEIYGSKSSFYLINGSSSGIVALMLAAVEPGEKVLIARNAHKSVINALVLSGAIPVWANTDWLDDWNIPAQINPENIRLHLEHNPEIKSVWITSPTYEGIVSDIKAIADICHEKNVLLIVDEAHGALWNFNGSFPLPAIKLGADASVQSLHKTASSLTQGAILHLGKNSRIDSQKVQQCLNLINTTSPSYLLLASIEASIEYLDSRKGQKNLDNLLENIDDFYKKLSKTDKISFLQESYNYKTDSTKLLFGIDGLSGYCLADILENRFNIEVEMDNNKGVLALTGIGTSKEKLDKLAEAVIKIVTEDFSDTETFTSDNKSLIKPEMILSPREAFYRNSKLVNTGESVGKIAKKTITPYPPGIPVLIAGERIKAEHLYFLKNYKKIDIIVDE
jgi:arginine decarboxylase